MFYPTGSGPDLNTLPVIGTGATGTYWSYELSNLPAGSYVILASLNFLTKVTLMSVALLQHPLLHDRNTGANTCTNLAFQTTTVHAYDGLSWPQGDSMSLTTAFTFTEPTNALFLGCANVVQQTSSSKLILLNFNMNAIRVGTLTSQP